MENWIIDRRLVEKALKEESAQIVEGKTNDGVPLMFIVVAGANVGLFKQHCGEVLPAIAVPRRTQ